MKQSNRILVIGWRPGFTQRARGLGLEVLYLQKKELFQDSQKEHADQVFLLDYSNTDLLLSFCRALHQILPFQYVVTLSEYALLVTALVNDALNLSGNSFHTVELLQDKAKMRAHLNDVGVSPVVALAGRSVEDLRRFVEEQGLPVIVKPIDGAGSYGVFLLERLEQIDEIAENSEQANIRSFLMEEYLDGPEYSVEAVSHQGRHVVIAITSKLTLPNFVEIGHFVPAQISLQEKSEIESSVLDFLDAVDFKEGPSHTEVKLTSRGVRIVEGHNRIGGDKINDLVRLATGVDMLTLTSGVPFGLLKLPDSPEASAGAAIRYFTPEPGVLLEVKGLEAAKEHKQVVNAASDVKIGAEVKVVRQSSDRAGFVLAEGTTAKEAVSVCEEILRSVQFITQA